MVTLINQTALKEFVNWILKKKRLKINFILGAIFVSLLSTENYFQQLDLSGVNIFRPAPVVIQAISDYPVKTTNITPPILSARSAIVIDIDSKTIIYEKNPDLKLLPASTTKIMTALVSLENYALTDVVTIGEIKTEKNIMDLKPGEKITVENLLSGLLIYSANDAAIALARFFPGGEIGFVKAMNEKAKALHLINTQFTNPVGFDDFGHYTTVHDLSLLTAAAMQQAALAKIVATISLTVADTENTVSHELVNVNKLLGQIPGLAGVKTGWTTLAGECLVGFTKRNGRGIITVVLGSVDRFGETQQLIDWAFLNYRFESLSAIHY